MERNDLSLSLLLLEIGVNINNHNHPFQKMSFHILGMLSFQQHNQVPIEKMKQLVVDNKNVNIR